MLHIRKMTIDDLEFAIGITRSMDWNLEKDDFLFMMELEPEGCFVLFDSGKRIGIATNISYRRIAWFGNLIVDENQRGKGGGSMLVTGSLDYLKKKGVKTLGLYAYIDKIPFYERLGFKKDVQYVVLQGKARSSRVKPDYILATTEQEFQEVIEYDAGCFGESREKSLLPIISDPDNRCYIRRQNRRIEGYVVAKISRKTAEIGPLVCQSGESNLAIDLLERLMSELDGKEVTLFVSEKDAVILTMLEDSGFREQLRLVRMFFGKPLMDRCLCLPESLERG